MECELESFFPDTSNLRPSGTAGGGIKKRSEPWKSTLDKIAGCIMFRKGKDSSHFKEVQSQYQPEQHFGWFHLFPLHFPLILLCRVNFNDLIRDICVTYNYSKVRDVGIGINSLILTIEGMVYREN